MISSYRAMGVKVYAHRCSWAEKEDSSSVFRRLPHLGLVSRQIRRVEGGRKEQTDEN